MAVLDISIRGNRVTISGVVDETADLSSLDKLTGRVELDLAGVTRINSAGVRLWMDALRPLGARADLVFHACSPTIIDQLNMMNGFLGHGRVESFYAQMLCPICEHEQRSLFRTSDVRANDDNLPQIACEKCGGHTEIDELSDQYLLFLREPTFVRA